MKSRPEDTDKLKARIAVLRVELQQAQTKLKNAHGGTKASSEPPTISVRAAADPVVMGSTPGPPSAQQGARTHTMAEHNQQDLESLFAILAHDLKHPVVGIQGLLSLIKADCLDKLDPDSQQNLDLSLAECQRMCRMLDQLGLLGRIESLKSTPQRVELSRFLSACINAFQARGRAQGVTIRLTAPRREVLIPCAHVEQALAHLLDNALKYGAPNPPGAIEVTGAVEEGLCRITVTDHGPGIDPRFHRRVFEPFRRLSRDEKVPGTGIGLTAVAEADAAY